MDGLTFLQKLMAQHPIPVVICSSLADDGCETTLRALELGAVDFITKPKLGTKLYLEESRIGICDTVKAAAGVRSPKGKHALSKVQPKLTADAVIAKGSGHAMIQTTERIVAVGASTGGTEALREFLEVLPVDCPGIVIVQHMPEKFTAAFAKRLDSICAVQVKEAEDGDTVIRGRALIAPGNAIPCSNEVAPDTTLKSRTVRWFPGTALRWTSCFARSRATPAATPSGSS